MRRETPPVPLVCSSRWKLCTPQGSVCAKQAGEERIIVTIVDRTYKISVVRVGSQGLNMPYCHEL